MITQILVSELVDRDEIKNINVQETKDLIESIREKGIIVPLIVKGNKVIDGSHRLYAAKQLGLETVPCHILANNTEEYTKSVFKIKTDPCEYAKLLKHLLNKYSIDEVAEKLEKSVSWIEQYLSLLSLIPDAQKAIKEEKLTVENALILVVSHNQEQDLKHAINKSYLEFIEYIKNV